MLFDSYVSYIHCLTCFPGCGVSSRLGHKAGCSVHTKILRQVHPSSSSVFIVSVVMRDSPTACLWTMAVNITHDTGRTYRLNRRQDSSPSHWRCATTMLPSEASCYSYRIAVISKRLRALSFNGGSHWIP